MLCEQPQNGNVGRKNKARKAQQASHTRRVLGGGEPLPMLLLAEEGERLLRKEEVNKFKYEYKEKEGEERVRKQVGRKNYGDLRAFISLLKDGDLNENDGATSFREGRGQIKPKGLAVPTNDLILSLLPDKARG